MKKHPFPISLCFLAISMAILACSLGRPEVIVPGRSSGDSTRAIYSGNAQIKEYYQYGEVVCENSGTATLYVDRIEGTFEMNVVGPSTHADCTLDGSKTAIDFLGDIGFGNGTDLSLVFRVCNPAVPDVAVGHMDYDPNGTRVMGGVDCFDTDGEKMANVTYELELQP
jgi:hypothetical protein